MCAFVSLCACVQLSWKQRTTTTPLLGKREVRGKRGRRDSKHFRPGSKLRPSRATESCYWGLSTCAARVPPMLIGQSIDVYGFG